MFSQFRSKDKNSNDENKTKNVNNNEKEKGEKNNNKDQQNNKDRDSKGSTDSKQDTKNKQTSNKETGGNNNNPNQKSKDTGKEDQSKHQQTRGDNGDGQGQSKVKHNEESRKTDKQTGEKNERNKQYGGNEERNKPYGGNDTHPGYKSYGDTSSNEQWKTSSSERNNEAGHKGKTNEQGYCDNRYVDNRGEGDQKKYHGQGKYTSDEYPTGNLNKERSSGNIDYDRIGDLYDEYTTGKVNNSGVDDYGTSKDNNTSVDNISSLAPGEENKHVFSMDKGERVLENKEDNELRRGILKNNLNAEVKNSKNDREQSGNTDTSTTSSNQQMRDPLYDEHRNGRRNNTNLLLHNIENRAYEMTKDENRSNKDYNKNKADFLNDGYVTDNTMRNAFANVMKTSNDRDIARHPIDDTKRNDKRNIPHNIGYNKEMIDSGFSGMNNEGRDESIVDLKTPLEDFTTIYETNQTHKESNEIEDQNNVKEHNLKMEANRNRNMEELGRGHDEDSDNDRETIDDTHSNGNTGTPRRNENRNIYDPNETLKDLDKLDTKILLKHNYQSQNNALNQLNYKDMENIFEKGTTESYGIFTVGKNITGSLENKQNLFPKTYGGGGRDPYSRKQDDSHVTGIILIASEDKLPGHYKHHHQGDNARHNKYQEDARNTYQQGEEGRVKYPGDMDGRNTHKEGTGGQFGSHQLHKDKRQQLLPAGDFAAKYNESIPAAGKRAGSDDATGGGAGRKKFTGKFNDSSAVFDTLHQNRNHTTGIGEPDRRYRAGTPYEGRDTFESRGGEKHGADKFGGSGGGKTNEADKYQHRSNKGRKQKSSSLESSSEEELEDDVEKELKEIEEEEKRKKRDKKLGQMGKNSSSTSSGESMTKKLSEGFSKLGKK
ncbi:hypothetical protein M8J75_013579 [Diaphorina citri]|nr:hypothetical protein M8J75_000710 [Diaphorina citri]KAI5698899.1 hypothetical protein M8J75_013579 [Diaphorina citri]